MKIDKAFETFSPAIQKLMKSYLEQNTDEIDLGLNKLYQSYSSGDLYYPRPLLMFMGCIAYNKEEVTISRLHEIGEVLLIPQIVRDFLAVHDDIVDEDTVKFGRDTLPLAFSKYVGHLDTNHISKKGNGLALFWGDYLICKIYNLVLNSNQTEETKIRMIRIINDALSNTQNGQISELLLQEKRLIEIDIDDIFDLYNKKAADYCYAFPFELGLSIGGASAESIKKSRGILLKIGVASQIIDDVVGLFPEIIDQNKDTISDLLHLRRTLMLVLLNKKLDGKDDEVSDILNKNSCSLEEANKVKLRILKEGIIAEIVVHTRSILQDIESEIEGMDFCSDTKSYIIDLIYQRIIKNLKQIEGY